MWRIMSVWHLENWCGLYTVVEILSVGCEVWQLFL